ncbi:MAG: hypothetical protein ABL958_21080 [Bdellovibrionia bacterium]
MKTSQTIATLFLSLAIQAQAQTPPRGAWHWNLGPGSENHATVEEACSTEGPVSSEILKVHRDARDEALGFFEDTAKLKAEGVVRNSPHFNDARAKTESFHNFNVKWEQMKGSTFQGFCAFKASGNANKALRDQIVTNGICSPTNFAALKSDYAALSALMAKNQKITEPLMSEWRANIQKFSAEAQTLEQYRANEDKIKVKIKSVDMAEFTFVTNVDDKEYPWPSFWTDSQWELACGPFVRQDPAEMLVVRRTLSGDLKATMQFTPDTVGGPSNQATAVECLTGLGETIPVKVRRSRVIAQKTLPLVGDFTFTRTETNFIRANNVVEKIQNPEESLFVLGVLAQSKLRAAIARRAAIPASCRAETMGANVKAILQTVPVPAGRGAPRAGTS